MARDRVAESWFEDSANLRELVGTAGGKSKAEASRLVLEEGLPKTRADWAERFLLMALHARAAKAPAEHARWPDFAVLAHELAGSRPLADIPLMVKVAERSVTVARSGVW
jgi:hypothetical protein